MMTGQDETFTENILVIGALGQIGQELTAALRQTYGSARVIAADLRLPEHSEGPFLQLSVLDRDALFDALRSHQISTVYNLAAILSAKGEQDPQTAWQINMEGLLNTLEAGRLGLVKQIFWPSSIAVFGPTTPRDLTPQQTVMEPSTVYGISKLAGERWCEYYHRRYGVDVRSLRYPGLIGYKSLPGGGTTDYAVEIFHEALRTGHYTCFLREDAALPMMYMSDAIRATIELMQAPAEKIQVRSAYNLAGISFTPAEIAAEIRTHLPGFICEYAPDFRQEIAASWPRSIDDSKAGEDWGWRPEWDLTAMCADMLHQVGEQMRVRVV